MQIYNKENPPPTLGTEILEDIEAIFDASSTGLWICDTTPRLLWINSAVENLNDIKREDVCGRTVEELLGRGNYDQSVTNQVLAKKEPIAIIQSVRSGRTLLVNGVPVFGDDGEILYVVGTERDVTELNMLREELEEKQQLNRKIQSELLAMKMRELNSHEIVAESEPMKRVLETAFRVADFDTTVLATGPSGAGKSLIARVIHDSSNRKEEPFLSLNCGALPQALVDAELFGYVGGAFTGAQKGGKSGLLEAADGGTLFLDEIDAFPLEVQVKLLTFLDTRRFIRVGATKFQQVDIRLLAATNKNLEEMVQQGSFREDLFFRLNIVQIDIPPLSQRREDIPLLASNILERLKKRYGVRRTLSPQVMERLCGYDFPGNVREINNILERAIVLCRGEQIRISDLPPELRETSHPQTQLNTTGTLKDAINEAEKACLEDAAAKFSRQADMATHLGISQPSIARLRKKHGLNV
jgi:PAS domain S-box-containing protein